MKFEIFKPMNTINWRSYRNLTNCCCICGTYEDVEMHHIKHIHKGKVIGFAQILKQLKPTTVPLCSIHHREVHQGKHDQTLISELFGINSLLC